MLLPTRLATAGTCAARLEGRAHYGAPAPSPARTPSPASAASPAAPAAQRHVTRSCHRVGTWPPPQLLVQAASRGCN